MATTHEAPHYTAQLLYLPTTSTILGPNIIPRTSVRNKHHQPSLRTRDKVLQKKKNMYKATFTVTFVHNVTYRLIAK
jgi:hypothetical protein